MLSDVVQCCCPHEPELVGGLLAPLSILVFFSGAGASECQSTECARHVPIIILWPRNDSFSNESELIRTPVCADQDLLPKNVLPNAQGVIIDEAAASLHAACLQDHMTELDQIFQWSLGPQADFT